MAEDSAKPWHTGSPRPASTPRLSKTRLALAFLVAAASDAVSYGTAFVPPVQWMVALVTALLLFGLLGWRCISRGGSRAGYRPLRIPHRISTGCRRLSEAVHHASLCGSLPPTLL
jgi:hypothetical protein